LAWRQVNRRGAEILNPDFLFLRVRLSLFLGGEKSTFSLPGFTQRRRGDDRASLTTFDSSTKTRSGDFAILIQSLYLRVAGCGFGFSFFGFFFSFLALFPLAIKSFCSERVVRNLRRI
jgi:hypothetical protein